MLFVYIPILLQGAALQDNQFPIRGADGHKGRALQMADTTLPRPKVSLRSLILRDNNSAAQ